jgi:general secretion pathway protein G
MRSKLFRVLAVLLFVLLVAGIFITNGPHKTGPIFESEITKAEIKNIQEAMGMYYLKNKKFPSNEQGIRALVSTQLIKQLPTDYWGNLIKYSASGNKYTLSSLGSDNAPGGNINASDIEVSWYIKNMQNDNTH